MNEARILRESENAPRGTLVLVCARCDVLSLCGSADEALEFLHAHDHGPRRWGS